MLFCRVAIETVEAKSMEAPMESWGERGEEIALTENVNGFEYGADEDEAEPGGDDVGIEMRRDGDWVRSVIVVVFWSPSEGRCT